MQLTRRKRIVPATALLAAAEERFLRLGGRRADAMVLVRNERARYAWSAAGYAPEERWRRWVKPLMAPSNASTRTTAFFRRCAANTST